MRETNRATLRAYLLIELNSLKYNKKDPNALTGGLDFINTGRTPGRIETYHAIVSGLDYPARDIRADFLGGMVPMDSTKSLFGRPPECIPPDWHLPYVSVIQGVAEVANPDGTFFLHSFLVYRDVLGALHDIYCVFKAVKTDTLVSVVEPPLYSVHDYAPAETLKMRGDKPEN